MIANLKPYSATKDSGIKWLGEVPVHWEVRRIKTVFREADNRGGKGTLLSLTRKRGVVPQADIANRPASAENTSAYKQCSPGNIVMNRMQAWSGMFAVSNIDGHISPDYSIFVPVAPSVSPHFFESLFRTPLLVGEFARRSKGIGNGFNRLYTPDFSAIKVVTPPTQEQTTIARFLDHANDRIDRYIRAKGKLIALLEEQKHVIVHNVVTGRIDVRTGKPYAEYKPSGVEWLGEVPAHWAVCRLKRICRLGYGDSLANDSRVPGEIAVYGSNGVVGQHDKANTIAPCIVVGRKGSFGKVNYSYEAAFAIDTTFFVDGRFSSADMRWLYHLLGWLRLDTVTKDSAIPGLDREDAYQRFVPLPVQAEQAAIASYLDSAIADITNTTDRASREICLLREYRTRLIADVVTGKLDVREAAAELPELNPVAVGAGTDTIQTDSISQLPETTPRKERNP